MVLTHFIRDTILVVVRHRGGNLCYYHLAIRLEGPYINRPASSLSLDDVGETQIKAIHWFTGLSSECPI